MKKQQLTFLIVFIFLTPYLLWGLLGSSSFVTIHDNLDGEFVYIFQLLQSGNLFGFDLNGVIENTMLGNPRAFYRSGFNLTFIIFSIFSPFWAYFTHHLLVHSIGFLGMYLLSSHYLTNKKHALSLLGALVFGWVDYYHIQYGISISGQPLLAFAFLNLLFGKKHWSNWFIIISFPFFSFLPVTLPFFFPFLFVIGLLHYTSTKSVPIPFLTALFIIGVLNVVIEFNLVYSAIISDLESHRIAWSKTQRDFSNYTFQDFLDHLHHFVNHAHYHGGNFNASLVLSAFLALAYTKRISKNALFFLLALSFVFLWVEFAPLVLKKLGENVMFFNTFNLERFYFLTPFLWIGFLISALNQLDIDKVILKIISFFIVGYLSLSVLDHNKEFKKNFYIATGIKNIKEPLFNQFFDQLIFTELRAFVEDKSGLKESWFINIGLFPNTLQYFGFYTLDSYQNNYLLSQKKNFESIILPELERDLVLKDYFQKWGSRCYAFSCELGADYMIHKNSNQEIESINYNWEIFNKLGGRYIVSVVPISQSKNPKLKFLKSFEHENSYYRLHLYEVKSATYPPNSDYPSNNH